MINQTGNPEALSITSDGWKFVPFGHGDSGLESLEEGEPDGMLFNLNEDPTEQHNLYRQHPEKVRALSRLLEEYRDTGYSRPGGDK